jgi:CheY-like chemotaxis protein
MKTLIVEDDENKLNQISEILSSVPDINLISRRSYQSGLKEIIANYYDLIVLDMSMPTYDKSSSEPGGRFRKFAGKEILAEINRRKIKTKALLVTGFDTFGEGSTFITLKEMNQMLASTFPTVYLGCVFYNASETNWTEELLHHVNTIMRDKND